MPGAPETSASLTALTQGLIDAYVEKLKTSETDPHTTPAGISIEELRIYGATLPGFGDQWTLDRYVFVPSLATIRAAMASPELSVIDWSTYEVGNSHVSFPVVRFKDGIDPEHAIEPSDLKGAFVGEKSLLDRCVGNLQRAGVVPLASSTLTPVT
jgi:hypothetical protein